MKLFPLILILLCFGCRTLDKKIVRMSAMSRAQPEVVIQPPMFKFTWPITEGVMQWEIWESTNLLQAWNPVAIVSTNFYSAPRTNKAKFYVVWDIVPWDNTNSFWFPGEPPTIN